MTETVSQTTVAEDWAGIRRGRRSNVLEWLVERVIFGVSLSAILLVFLIFIFVGREALPIVLGTMSSAAAQKVIPPDQLDKIPKAELMAYLDLTAAQYDAMDKETLQSLMEVRAEGAKEAPKDKDAAVNTTEWRYLIYPYQWSGYEKPEYIWQPISSIHKYNIIPLIMGSLKTTFVAMFFGLPLAIGAAIYVSQLAPIRVREMAKPGIELLAGVPSVVLGSFAYLVMATFFQEIFHNKYRLNAIIAGMALALSAIPVIFSIAEDALTSVPRSYTQAALALGSSRWQAAWQIVLPAALPGVFAAALLGFGRCLGETMIVLMASGNASIPNWDLTVPTRTITATIAAEVMEAVNGGHHYRMLFLIGTLLFAVTFVCNWLGELVTHNLKLRLEGKKR